VQPATEGALGPRVAGFVLRKEKAEARGRR
jgi:hypothetical protein